MGRFFQKQFEISIKKITTTILLVLYAAQAQSSEQKPITVYAYHLKPPFIVDLKKETGLYYDFSKFLNSKGDTYQFRTFFVPRKRVEVYVENKQLDGILIGVNPIWFQDKEEQKYLWSPKVFADQDEIVSLAKRPFNYSGPESLIGMNLGGVLGFYYYGIDDLVKTGEIQRRNTSSEQSILSMILRERVNAGIVSRSTLNYLVPRKHWQGKFYISPKPHDSFNRRLLIPHEQKAVYDYLLPILENLDSDPEWQAILRMYD